MKLLNLAISIANHGLQSDRLKQAVCHPPKTLLEFVSDWVFSSSSFCLRRKLMNFLPHTRRLIKWNLLTRLIKNVKGIWKPLYSPSLGEVSLIRNNLLITIIIKKPTSAIYDYQVSTYGNISSRASSIFPENGRHERSNRLFFVLAVFAHTFQTG